MKIIIIHNATDKGTNVPYIKELSAKIINSVYLDITNLYEVFGRPSVSAFTGQYTYDERIKVPSHETLLELARDNLSLGKSIIFAGDIDYKMLNEMIVKSSLKANIKAICMGLPSEDVALSLTQLAQGQILNFDISTKQGGLKLLLEFVEGASVDDERKTLPKKQVVLATGLGGVGKSTHLRKVCRELLNSVYLDSDWPTVPFLKSVKQPLASDYYGTHVKGQRYAVMLEFAKQNAMNGKLPIVEGCYGDKLTGTLVKGFLAIPSIVLDVFYFHCSGPTQEKWVKQRGASRDAGKTDLAEDRRKNLEKHAIEFVQCSNIKKIDTDDEKGLDNNVKETISHVQSQDKAPFSIDARDAPLDQSICKITLEQAQGGLKEFTRLLDAMIVKDKADQKAKSMSLSKSRNLLWATCKVVLMEGEGAKLASGSAHLWPEIDPETASEETRANRVPYYRPS